MKKLFLFIVVGLFVINTNAQDKPTSDEGVKFGVKAGVNFATITGDDTEDVKSRTGFHIGGVVEIPVSEQFSVQPELLYSAQGAKYDEVGFETTAKLDYLNIPVMAKFYVADGFSLEAGPQVGFLLSAKADVDSSLGGGSVDIKDIINGVDFGLNFGLGYKMETGLNFGARYNLGLSNINDHEFDYEDFNNKNGVFQISVGYFF